MLNENTFLIEKLQHELTQDLDQWLSFQDLSEEERNEICENIASEEYENIDDYDLAGNEGIYENASEKMGYIREDTWQEDEKNLRYNLSYSQGDHAYLRGRYNLQTLLKNNGASKQLLKDLNYLLKMSITVWEQNAYDSNLDDFININRNGQKNNCFYFTRKDTYKTNWEHATDAGELIASIGNFTLSNGRTPVCVKRILKELKEKDIETAFENYEYNLKRELYENMETLEKDNKEYWIEEMLKPELKGEYNRATKQFIRDTTKTYYIN